MDTNKYNPKGIITTHNSLYFNEQCHLSDLQSRRLVTRNAGLC